MINFSNIYALFGLISLPIIFFIMKLLRPLNPKKTEFSSFFILRKISQKILQKLNLHCGLLLFRILLCFFIVSIF